MPKIAQPAQRQQQTAAVWPPVVGTLVGESTSTKFRLAVKQETIREQDLIAVDGELRQPDSQAVEAIRIWAKVKRIERLNPLFPKLHFPRKSYSYTAKRSSCSANSRNLCLFGRPPKPAWIS